MNVDKRCTCVENQEWASIEAYSFNESNSGPKDYTIRLSVSGSQMDIKPRQWDALMRAIKLFESENMIY